MSGLEAFNKVVDEKKEYCVEQLRKAVAIDSVSGEPERRPKVLEMAEFIKKEAERLGASVKFIDVGIQTTNEGKKIPYPPIIEISFTKDESKPTLGIYAHYDVQPAYKSDGWNTEPFEMTEVDGKYYGRGTTDDKGPLIGWLLYIEFMQQLKQDIPVNIKMALEGTEESGSHGMSEYIWAASKGFLSDVDYFCISDNYWLGTSKPCLTYGLRGICYWELEAKCCGKDLHSGVFGGAVASFESQANVLRAVHEAMTDLMYVMSRMIAPDGKILVPGLDKGVRVVTEEENKSYDTIDFDISKFQSESKLNGTQYPDKKNTLMHRWRYPSLSLHGIEGAWSGKGAKTVIPGNVIGKFSVRLVPDMKPDDVHKAVSDHIAGLWKELKTPNTYELRLLHGAKAWVSDPNNANFAAARKATKKVYGVDPDLTREGGSIPITLDFEESTGKSMMLLPMGAADDGAHSQNEKIDARNYFNGIKLFAAYIDELAKAHKSK